MQLDNSLPRVQAGSRFLPGFARSPREVCAQVGLQWFAALGLAADGYLSFNPDTVASMDEGQDAELWFVGTLAAWANDRGLLDRLLSGLQRPYCYRLDCMWYDWRCGAWKELPETEDRDEPDEPDREDMLADWLGDLVAAGDTAQLLSMQNQIDGAIRQVAHAGVPR